MDPQNCKEYAKELEKSSGSDFHKRVLNRRRTSELLAIRNSSSSSDISQDKQLPSAELSQEEVDVLLNDERKSGDKRALEDSFGSCAKFARCVAAFLFKRM